MADLSEADLGKTASFKAHFKVLIRPRTLGGLKGTEVELSGPDVNGLLACMTGTLYARGYDIHSTKGETLSVGGPLGVRDTFVVTRHGLPLDMDEQNACQSALTDTAARLYAAAQREAKQGPSYTVEVEDDEAAKTTVLIIEGPDVSGLLGAITSTLSASSCSIVSFGGETTSEGLVRDRFVVQVEGKPLDVGIRAPIVRRLQQACRKLHSPKDENGHGGSGDVAPKFEVRVEDTSTDTKITVDGPDVPGLLSKLSAALTSDGYEIIAFDAGTGTAGAQRSNLVDEGERVHDVFRVTREGKPLSSKESEQLKAWMEQVSDNAYSEAARLYRSTGGTSVGSSEPLMMRVKGGNRKFSPMRLFGCMPNRAGHSKIDADVLDSFSQIYELTALERQGLIAALKAKGSEFSMAAEHLMAGGKDLTEDEVDTLKAALGDGSVSDVMKRSQIDPTEITVGEVIGSGAFGEVRAGSYHGTPIAIKTMHRTGLTNGGLDHFKAECELCLSLRHPNIVQLIGACWRLDAATVFHVMERCENNLSELLRDAKAGRKSGEALAKGRLGISIGVARAMSYLHSQKPPILHRDLKPDNVLLTSDLTAKVSDFGSSRDVASMAMTQVGTPLFAAPEIMAHEPYDGSADVWSFGCILSCLYYLAAEPYTKSEIENGNVGATMKAVINGTLKPALPLENAFGDLGRRCVQLDPSRRPAFLQLVEQLGQPEMAKWQEEEVQAAVAKASEGGWKWSS